MDIPKDSLHHYSDLLLSGDFFSPKGGEMEGALAIHRRQCSDPSHGLAPYGGRLFFAFAFQQKTAGGDFFVFSLRH